MKRSVLLYDLVIKYNPWLLLFIFDSFREIYKGSIRLTKHRKYVFLTKYVKLYFLTQKNLRTHPGFCQSPSGLNVCQLRRHGGLGMFALKVLLEGFGVGHLCLRGGSNVKYVKYTHKKICGF